MSIKKFNKMEFEKTEGIEDESSIIILILDMCVVCLSKQREYAFIPCLHRVLCEDCAFLFLKKGIKTCSICKGQTTDIKKVFG